MTITADSPFLVQGGASRITRERFIAVLQQLAAPAVISERDAGEYFDKIIATKTEDGKNLDPLFALAMFSHESQMGREGVARTTHSWGNTRDPTFGGVPVVDSVPGLTGEFPVFRDWMDGLISTVARLVTKAWVYNGVSTHPITKQTYPARTKIIEIFDHPSTLVWAPAGDRNDPKGYLRSILDFMNRYADAGEQGNAEPITIVVSAGHWDSTGDDWGGEERARTRPLAIAISDEAERRGFRVIRQVDPFAGTYREVAVWCAQQAQKHGARMLLQVHFEGTNPAVRGSFGVYPSNAGRDDFDADARRIGQDISRRLRDATGMPMRNDGSMAESDTNAGELAWFSRSVGLKANTERLLMEYGASNSNMDDRAIVDSPGFYQKAAVATVEALEAFYGIQAQPEPGEPTNPIVVPPAVPDPWGSPYGDLWIPVPFRDEIAAKDWMTTGYMLGGAIVEDGKLVQYAQRARLELQPNGQVTRGLIGAELLEARAEIEKLRTVIQSLQAEIDYLSG